MIAMVVIRIRIERHRPADVPATAFSSEAETGSRDENASNKT